MYIYLTKISNPKIRKKWGKFIVGEIYTEITVNEIKKKKKFHAKCLK